MAGWLDPKNPRQNWLEPESQTAFDVTEEQEDPANWTGQEEAKAPGAVAPASQGERSAAPEHPAGMPVSGLPQSAPQAQTLPTTQDSPAHDDPDDATQGIVHIILRCPRCNTPNPKITSTQGPTRYHKCQKCGLRFKSVWV